MFEGWTWLGGRFVVMGVGVRVDTVTGENGAMFKQG